MLKWLRSKMTSKSNDAPIKDFIEEEPADGIFMTKFEVAALFDARKNEFVQYNTLHIEGNPDRLGLLIRAIAEKEAPIQKIIDIAAGKKEPEVQTEVFKGMPDGKGGVIPNAPSPSAEMSDEEIKEMIRKNNKDMYGHDMFGDEPA